MNPARISRRPVLYYNKGARLDLTDAITNSLNAKYKPK